LSTDSKNWDESADVVVVGTGFAGTAAAIAAHDAGARVVMLEKMAFPGGISILAGGGICVARDADAAFAYLQATCAGTTPDEVLRAPMAWLTSTPSLKVSPARAKPR